MPTKKITVLSSTVTKQADDGRWKLSELVATDERGEGIDKTLKTFETNLPLNQLIEVEVEKNGDYDEYMVRLPGSKKGGGGGGKGGLGASVDLLRTEVEQLRTRVGAIEGRLEAQDQAKASGFGTPPPAPTTSDDDIPF